MKFLTIMMLFKTCISVLILQTLSGCSIKGDAYTMYTELPTHQPNDPMLSCEQLDHELSLVNAAIDDMSHSIVKLEESEKSLGVMSSLSVVQGDYAPIPMAPFLLNQDVVKMKHVRHTFQKRSDFLIQQFYTKGCASQDVAPIIPEVAPEKIIQTI